MSVKQIKNILNLDTLSIIKKNNMDVFIKQINNLQKSKEFWNYKIVQFSNDVSIYNLPTDSLEFDLIKKDIDKLNLEVNIQGIMYYYWQPGSYIPWHNDGIYSNSITIYLNNKWDYSEGGLFLYKDGNDIKTIIPSDNLGVIQTGGVEHSTTITNTESPIRKTIQIFLNDKKHNTLL